MPIPPSGRTCSHNHRHNGHAPTTQRAPTTLFHTSNRPTRSNRRTLHTRCCPWPRRSKPSRDNASRSCARLQLRERQLASDRLAIGRASRDRNDSVSSKSGYSDGSRQVTISPNSSLGGSRRSRRQFDGRARLETFGLKHDSRTSSVAAQLGVTGTNAAPRCGRGRATCGADTQAAAEQKQPGRQPALHRHDGTIAVAAPRACGAAVASQPIQRGASLISERERMIGARDWPTLLDRHRLRRLVTAEASTSARRGRK
jgi:hypothetical protein